MLQAAIENAPEPATQNARAQEMAILGKLLALYQGAVASMARIVPLERQALNIDDRPVNDISSLSRDEAEAELARLRSLQGA